MLLDHAPTTSSPCDGAIRRRSSTGLTLFEETSYVFFFCVGRQDALSWTGLNSPASTWTRLIFELDSLCGLVWMLWTPNGLAATGLALDWLQPGFFDDQARFASTGIAATELASSTLRLGTRLLPLRSRTSLLRLDSPSSTSTSTGTFCFDWILLLRLVSLWTSTGLAFLGWTRLVRLNWLSSNALAFFHWPRLL
jgi:hypothetical protein